jgi:hypothetical protein
VGSRSVLKLYHSRGIAGLVARIKHPDTGAELSVYAAEQAGIDADEPWAAVCETHGSILSCSTRAIARERLDYPE